MIAQEIAQGRVRGIRPASWVLVLLLTAAVFAGCATIGHPFPPEQVNQIRVGETSKAELLGTFGLPYRRGVDDGDSTWTFLHYKVRLFGEHLRTRDLYVRFTSQGLVKSFSYNSNMED